MPLFNPFSHYLAYLATDQQTFRDLRGEYDGVLVPGTIAAWQREGTGGFVLSLSATEASPPYVIDPRFPLFQQGLRNAKQSHTALAGLLGDPSLVTAFDPTPDAFGDDRLRAVASGWIEFNAAYGGGTSNKTFDKYAQRLGDERPVATDARSPEAVLAPYFVAQHAADPWWALSKRLFTYTTAAANGTIACLRVVAAAFGDALPELLADVDDERVLIWVSGLDEHKAPAKELQVYRRAIEEAAARGQRPFALYGGFFSVLLSSVGLIGASHGVGFSEHRNWRELPESGAPPARFYLRRWHRYVPPDLAQILWEADQTLVACPCPHCDGRPPNQLTYHDLMKHSVWCRQDEIRLWRDRPLATAAQILKDEHEALDTEIRDLPSLLPRLRTRALSFLDHLPRWVKALTEDA
jgi:hypothetical protein